MVFLSLLWSSSDHYPSENLFGRGLHNFRAILGLLLHGWTLERQWEDRASNDFAVSPHNQGNSTVVLRQQTWRQGECELCGKATDSWWRTWAYGSDSKAMVWSMQLVSVTELCDQPASWKEIYSPECREGMNRLRGSVKPEAQGVDAEGRKGDFSAWLPAGIPVGRKKRVDQESRKRSEARGKKNHRCPKFPQFYQKIFHDSSCDFSPNLIW